eukprot:552785-Amphidinium_carterae.1
MHGCKTASPAAWLFSQDLARAISHPNPSPTPKQKIRDSTNDVLTSLAWLLRQPVQMHGSSAKTWPGPSFTPQAQGSMARSKMKAYTTLGRNCHQGT